jgi:hypothetical protein
MELTSLFSTIQDFPVVFLHYARHSTPVVIAHLFCTAVSSLFRFFIHSLTSQRSASLSRLTILLKDKRTYAHPLTFRPVNMTSQGLQAAGNKKARRHLRSTSIHRVTACLLLLSLGTLVDSLDTAIPDFRIALNFLGGAFFQCQAFDSEMIRTTSQNCLRLLVGACGIDSQIVSVASGECDGSSAILRGGNMVTTGSFPPAPKDVSQCVQDIFRSDICLDFFKVVYPYIDTISLGLDVPMATSGPSASPTKSPMPSALSSLSPSLSPTTTDAISTDESGLGRDAINSPAPGSSDSNNIAVIIGSVVGVALLAGLLAMFAYKREKKQKAWREGAMRDVTLDDVDEDDIEAHHHVVDNPRTKEGLLYPAPESSDTGSSLFGRMLASTATVALGALHFRSENNDEATQENSAEDNLGSSEDDASTENACGPKGNDLAAPRDDRASDLEGAQAGKDKIMPVSILRNPRERLAAEALPTVTPDIVSAPNATNLEGAESDAVSPVESKANILTPHSAMGLLTCAMHPFHCLAPKSQDQLSEGSSIPYQTDFGPDESWDPDDNSIGSTEGEDNFQTTKPASPIDRMRLLESVTKKSFEMQRLRTPVETEPYRPKYYL